MEAEVEGFEQFVEVRERALRVFDDMPEAQVAQVLNCAVGTVKSTMSQALAAGWPGAE